MILLILSWASVLSFALMMVLAILWLTFFRYNGNKAIEFLAHCCASVGLVSSFIWGYLFLRMWHGY
jgi:hypothetical protein